MGTIDRETLDQVVASVVAVADPEVIILFGPRARGDAREDSDLDLLVVEERPFGAERSRRRETTAIRRALPRLSVGADIVVYSSDEVRRWRGSRNYLVGRVFREGKVLFQRP